MNATNYLEQLFGEVLHAGRVLSFPDGLWAALFTANPGEAGGGTEVSGGGYARVRMPPQSVVGGSTSNALSVSWPSPTAAWGSVVAFGAQCVMLPLLVYHSHTIQLPFC